jgi:hypothetical protein
MNAKRFSLTLVVACVCFNVAGQASAYYAAHMGRWLTRDSAGENGRLEMIAASGHGSSTSFIVRDEFDLAVQYNDGMNLYQYVQSSPTRATDPLGLETFYICGQDFPSTPPNGGTDTQRCCAAACGCNHTAIYGDESGEIYDGWYGPVKPGPGAAPMPSGPGYDCIKLKRCNYSGSYGIWPFRKRYDKHLQWGPPGVKGKTCASASSADIAACMRSKPKPRGNPGMVHNCQTDVEDASRGCCLCGYTGLSIIPPPIITGF